MENAVLETQNEFNDPAIAERILYNIQIAQSREDDPYQTRGKLTMGAKVAAKTLREITQRVGQKAWDAMVEKVENATGTQLVVFHWKSINQVIDFLADSKDSIEDALTEFLVNRGFNKTLAEYTSKAFVLVVF